MLIVPIFRNTNRDKTTHRKLNSTNNVQFKLFKDTEGEIVGLRRMAQREKFWSTRAGMQALRLDEPVFNPKSALN